MANTKSAFTSRPVHQAKKPSRLLTSAQLAELKKGSKANVIIGPNGDRYIGIEGASINLLAYFSPHAKKKLQDEGATNLWIPDGSKASIRWIYKYMQAGEADVKDQEKFESLSFDKLVSVYAHCAVLEYQPLMDRAFGRLKGKIYTSLPSVHEIKALEAFVAPLYDTAITILAHEMTHPWACDYSAYSELAMADQTFGNKLEEAIKNLLAHRVKAGKNYYDSAKNRQVHWSKQYYKNLEHAHINSSEQATTESKSKNSSATQKNRAGQTKTQKSAKTFTCYNCCKEGHIARNCDSSRKTDPPGHVANTHARDTSGRNRNYRRAQNDRFAHRIDVAGNGEGLRTCDREVRKGDVTRTGLII
jgi:hypothetical protein